MDFEEMNQRAYDRKPEPDGLTPAERMIWLALRLLYELHFHGGLTREEGVAYKQELKKDYERNLAQEAEWLRAGPRCRSSDPPRRRSPRHVRSRGEEDRRGSRNDVLRRRTASEIHKKRKRVHRY